MAVGETTAEEIVLQLDLDTGQNADAIVAAEALIAWVEAIRAANAALDPLGTVEVELVTAEAACLRLKTVLRFIEQKVLSPPADYLVEFPKIRRIAVATVVGLPLGVTLAVGAYLLSDSGEEMSVEAHEQYHREQAKLRDDAQVQAKVRKFYKKLEQDGSIKSVQVRDRANRPLVKVPREEFPERSGLWAPQDAAPQERPQRGEWDVVLTHPALVSKPEAWRFQREGLPFRAKMTDQAFLIAMREDRLPIHFKEGVSMRVRVEWQERLVGQIWEAIPRTYKVTKVIAPQPLPSPAPLFSGR